MHLSRVWLGSYSVCVATSCSQVKQKFSFTSKFLLFIFRINHQGNEERMLLLWVVVKNWLSNLVSPAHTKNQALQLWSQWHICLLMFYYIYYCRCSVVHYFLLFFFSENLIYGYNYSVWELSILVFYKYWLKQNAVKCKTLWLPSHVFVVFVLKCFHIPLSGRNSLLSFWLCCLPWNQ